MKIFSFIRLSSALTLYAMSFGVINAEDTSAFLSFERTDGTVVSVSSDNLSISFTNGNLVADNGSENVTVALSDLRRFYFAATSGAQIPAVSSAEVEYSIYGTNGVLLDTVRDLAECSAKLPAGVYIVKSSDRTFKIVVK